VQETDVTVQQDVKNKVDILFMVDDSQSMIPKQQALQARFPDLIKVLDDFGAKGSPAWYHIGVVTSDLGSAQSRDAGCTPGGLGGRLQTIGRGTPNKYPDGTACTAVTGGVNFIDYNQLNMTNNLPAGRSLGDQFTCMANVGTVGCGFEQQLESPFKALKGCMPDANGNYPNCSIAENKGFLRYDSIAVVVWITDEDDDCSAPSDSDLFDLNKTGTYGSLLSYRGTNYGVMCQQNGMDALMPYADSGGPLMGCHGAPNPMTITTDLGNDQGAPPNGQGKCMDVQRYINFYQKTLDNGGLRVDPNDVILTAIDAPETPVQSFIGNPSTYAPCAAGATVDGKNCAVLLQHSCNASASFFGDPAVRINQVINSVTNKNITSICAADYSTALQTLGMQIVSHLGVACLSSPITDPAAPDCVVEDRLNADDSVVDSIPACATNGNVQPCWAYQQNDKCPQVVNPANCTVTQGSIAINRDQSSIPPGTHARVACATLAHSSNAGNCSANPSPSP
jgi:hypothetical protein